MMALAAGLMLNGSPIKAADQTVTGTTGTVPVKVSIAPTPINVTVPASVDFAFVADSVDAVAASNLTIKNNSKVGNIKVTNVKTTAKASGWTLKPKGAANYFETLPLDSKQLYVGISKDSAASKTYSDIASTAFAPTDWKISPGATLPIFFEAKTGAVSSDLTTTNVADITMTLAYEVKA